jgi:hypothetical protein
VAFAVQRAAVTVRAAAARKIGAGRMKLPQG